jgi:hypothetical protein
MKIESNNFKNWRDWPNFLSQWPKLVASVLVAKNSESVTGTGFWHGQSPLSGGASRRQ